MSNAMKTANMTATDKVIAAGRARMFWAPNGDSVRVEVDGKYHSMLGSVRACAKILKMSPEDTARKYARLSIAESIESGRLSA